MNYAVTLATALLGWILVWLAVRQMNAVTKRTRHRWLRTLVWAPVAGVGLYLGLKPALAEQASAATEITRAASQS